MTNERVDQLLVSQGLVDSLDQAQRIVMAGQVRADGQLITKPSTRVQPGAQLEVARLPRYVSRGGRKLEAALEAFQAPVAGLVCADVGASTGGFSDCLLQHGASRVYAIDVGQGILHWKLRKDPRVVVMEGTNARYLEYLPEPIQLVTADAAFISLKVLLPVLLNWFPQSGGDLIALIKPQYETDREAADRGSGVIRDPQIHRQVLKSVLEFASQLGFALKGLIRSPIFGPKGNTEFLAWLRSTGTGIQDWESLVEGVIADKTAG